MEQIAANAILATLKISVWAAKKLDRAVTDETNARHGAASDAGNYNKALLAKGALAAVTQAATEIRTFHYDRTSPWLDDGSRILSVAGLAEYRAGIKERTEKFRAAVNTFVIDYPSLRGEASARLGQMFRADDYPAASQMADKFGVSSRILPVPQSSDFRVKLGDVAETEIKDALDDATEQGARVASRDAWQRINEHVTRMEERLAAFVPANATDKAQNIFRDSVVTNLCQLCAALPSLNLSNDPLLSAMRDQIDGELCYYSADELREDSNARAVTLTSARTILADVERALSAMV